MLLYRNKILLNTIFSSVLYSVLASYVLKHIGHQDAVDLTLVSILIILWEFVKGSFRILNMQDPVKFDSGSCTKSSYFPSHRILSRLTKDPVFHPNIFLLIGYFKVSQDPSQDYFRFLFRLSFWLIVQDHVKIYFWSYSGSWEE
jgi:hypothetical protein